jgi:DNA-3-methyladenine glycosylase II
MSENHELIEISTPKEFSFAINMSYLSHSPNECMHHIADNKIYKLIPIQGESILIEVSSHVAGHLLVRIPVNTIEVSEEIRSAVTRYVKDWFDLETNLTAFYKLAKSDFLLKQVVDQFYGLRNMGIPDFFEAICWGIIGQQINLTFAYTLKRRFVEAFGESVDWQGRKYWSFPTADRIAKLSVSDLSGLKMTAKKSEYMIGVAQLIVDDELSKELLMGSEDLKAAEKKLVAIRGIGPWTANYVLMRCLRFPTAFPIADVGLHNAIKFLRGTTNKPTLEEIRQHALAWANWESYATFYLWRLLY